MSKAKAIKQHCLKCSCAGLRKFCHATIKFFRQMTLNLSELVRGVPQGISGISVYAYDEQPVTINEIWKQRNITQRIIFLGTFRTITS